MLQTEECYRNDRKLIDKNIQSMYEMYEVIQKSADKDLGAKFLETHIELQWVLGRYKELINSFLEQSKQ